MPNEEQKANREEIIKNTNETMFSNILKILERRFIENGAGKYIVWNKVSLPDIFLSNSFAQFFNSKVMNEFFSDLSEQFPLKVSEIIKVDRWGVGFWHESELCVNIEFWKTPSYSVWIQLESSLIAFATLVFFKTTETSQVPVTQDFVIEI